MPKKPDDTKPADNPHVFHVRRAFHDGERQREVGETIDLAHADPRRVRAMRSAGMLYTPDEWAQAARSARAATIRRQAAEEAAAIGADCQGRAEATAAKIEAEARARAANAAAEARAKIMSEREARLRELRERTEAQLAELAPDEPLPPRAA